MRTVFILFLFMGLTAQGYAQADSTNIRVANLKWKSHEFMDSAKGLYIEHSSYFITHGERSIEWYQQKDGEEKITTFSVSQVQGSWPDVSGSGTITYQVSLNNVHGLIVFQCDGERITAAMVFNHSSVGNLNYVYTISSLENL
jgi:hypothetical protein